MPVRQLLPAASDEVDLADAYRPPTIPPDRPFVRCNMISTLDGAVSLNGASGMLGGPPDRRVFQVLRSLADVILVGAGTVRAERYGPARLDDVLRAQREDRGQPAVPPIAVITGSVNIDWSGRFFVEAEQRPIIFTTRSTVKSARAAGGHIADVIAAGEVRVEIPAVVDHLHRAGHRSILLEGGPGINAEVVAAGLLDELCLTLAPMLVAGAGPRVLAGSELVPPLRLQIVHLLEEDGFCFYRLRVERESAP